MTSTPSLPNLTGKLALVTGSTNGIGFIMVRELARLGAQVVLVGRNQAKLDAAIANILNSLKVPPPDAGNSTIRLSWLQADLSEMGQVRRLAKEFQDRYDQLDILINNAGAFFLNPTLTPDGLETTIALNHLAYFLLTNLLLPHLQISGTAEQPARIVNVSSNA